MKAVSQIMRLHVVVEGTVQGVGFRAFVAEAAQTRRLTGWVRNILDGNVEVVAEGSQLQLEELLDVLRAGPNHSEVTKVTLSWSEGEPSFSSFFIAKSK